MLESVSVKNFALIREAEVEFGKGLNILTGETGAGKSIIIGSIGLTLGAKASADVIREGAEYALSELTFKVSDEDQIKAIKAMDLPVEEDGTVILSRKISAGRSVLKVCGESVTLKQMRELAGILIDIHGQHEHQSLLKPSKQRELLDAYCGEEMEKVLEDIRASYRNYCAVTEKIAELNVDDARRQREISLAEYEVGEIEAANIIPGEEEELERTHRKMKNSSSVFEYLNNVQELLQSDGEGLLDAAGRAVHEMNAAMTLDDDLKALCEDLTSAEEVLRDVSRGIDSYMEKTDFDEAAFRETEERMDVLNHLMSKYGSTTEKVLEYCEKRKTELEELSDLDETLARLEKEKSEAEAVLKRACDKAHEIRCSQAVILEKEITETLLDLNFLKVKFSISVNETKDYSIYGNDEVEFLISLNPGEKVRALSEVASGGELSRIMLALKSVFARKDAIGTLIFDEIDTGISGKTAWKVSEKMAAIAKDHQVICITHLPQIAAMADSHFMIEKDEHEGRTETNIIKLDEKAQTEELARMLGGDVITDAVLANARDLKLQAAEVKKQ
ncbi:MAG: DNA repair protein RecN [Lachnospiraceae bacterium]|nr:DNA repair protein RecN [Lachnospiraceae bacterium]